MKFNMFSALNAYFCFAVALAFPPTRTISAAASSPLKLAVKDNQAETQIFRILNILAIDSSEVTSALSAEATRFLKIPAAREPILLRRDDEDDIDGDSEEGDMALMSRDVPAEEDGKAEDSTAEHFILERRDPVFFEDLGELPPHSRNCPPLYLPIHCDKRKGRWVADSYPMEGATSTDDTMCGKELDAQWHCNQEMGVWEADKHDGTDPTSQVIQGMPIATISAAVVGSAKRPPVPTVPVSPKMRELEKRDLETRELEKRKGARKQERRDRARSIIGRWNSERMGPSSAIPDLGEDRPLNTMPRSGEDVATEMDAPLATEASAAEAEATTVQAAPTTAETAAATGASAATAAGAVEKVTVEAGESTDVASASSSTEPNDSPSSVPNEPSSGVGPRRSTSSGPVMYGTGTVTGPPTELATSGPIMYPSGTVRDLTTEGAAASPVVT